MEYGVYSPVKLEVKGCGYYYNSRHEKKEIKSFTWTNNNNVKVSVINYAAKITCISYPDRNRHICNIVAQYGLPRYFEDVLYDDNFIIRKRQFEPRRLIDSLPSSSRVTPKQCRSLWDHHILGNKVILMHTEENYANFRPCSCKVGQLTLCISYELFPDNEFRIEYTAHSDQCMKVTIPVHCCFNLSNLNDTAASTSTSKGKHRITLHPDCKSSDKTTFVRSRDIIDRCCDIQSHPDVSFVARIEHVENGRILEVYSNKAVMDFKIESRMSLNSDEDEDDSGQCCSGPLVYKDITTLELFEAISYEVTQVQKKDKINSYAEVFAFMNDKLMNTNEIPFEKWFEGIADLNNIRLTVTQKTYVEYIIGIIKNLKRTKYVVEIMDLLKKAMSDENKWLYSFSICDKKRHRRIKKTEQPCDCEEVYVQAQKFLDVDCNDLSLYWQNSDSEDRYVLVYKFITNNPKSKSLFSRKL